MTTVPDLPGVLRRDEMLRLLNDALVLEAARTAVVTIDCHRGHLDPEVATMPVAPEHAAAVVANTARLLEGTRRLGIPVIHVILRNRVLSDGVVEPMNNPFWNAVEAAKQQLTPDRPSTISGHNLVGSVQTELMPEIGPEPGDIVVDSKHRLSIYLGTDLDMTLRQLAVDTVILVGINTNTCVQCAAFESMNRDLTTVVVSDCVQTMYGQDLHALGLHNVARCLGWVLDVDETLAKLGASDGRTR